jgi:hypothetical protein
MQHLVSLLEQCGLSFVFVHVLAEQAGVPLPPAYPTLIVAGRSARTRITTFPNCCSQRSQRR